jgi:hypothetical protein
MGIQKTKRRPLQRRSHEPAHSAPPEAPATRGPGHHKARGAKNKKGGGAPTTPPPPSGRPPPRAAAPREGRDRPRPTPPAARVSQGPTPRNEKTRGAKAPEARKRKASGFSLDGQLFGIEWNHRDNPPLASLGARSYLGAAAKCRVL